MLPPPPSSLAIVATAHETRIQLDYGRPLHGIARYKRAIVALWIGLAVVAAVLSPGFCWAGVVGIFGVGLVYALDLARVVMAEVVLRRDGLVLVHRRWSGLAPRVVPWTSIQEVALASQSGEHRGRDAVRVAWREGDITRVARFGIGRNRQELDWMRLAVETLHSSLARAVTLEISEIAEAVASRAAPADQAARTPLPAAESRARPQATRAPTDPDPARPET